MKKILKKTAFTLTLLTGLLLVFIGGRFLFHPEAAETAFGISVPVHGNFSFHYIKGIRDLCAGAALMGLLLTGERRGVGVLLLAITPVPVVDLSLVLRAPNHIATALYPHLIAIVLGAALGIYYIFSTNKNQKHAAL
ncbi:DUF4267 domain-containing protein [Olivibacter sp. SDN3]|uniref:DUF4267 domain-containing protein n=1 Tax=Olivibacter sp. SDN3 TaxID=2764720 RepID=UPI001651AA09|nr:DUF4267 domain-containing protein [Olivibacter sp. SDN3]QNL48063.1 DUF4267 domain-containing protein [Olivibacter sp. SDN3]